MPDFQRLIRPTVKHGLAAMESPFRGEISVGPEAFKLGYEQLMKPAK
jgi:hypothetical protein